MTSSNPVEIATAIAAWAALLASVVAIWIGARQWRANNRPIVTARVETWDHGDGSIFLNLVVENTGARPAKDVCLIVTDVDLATALAPEVPDDIRAEVTGPFTRKFRIPILANQKLVSNAFGVLAGDFSLNRRLNTWNWHHRLPIVVEYSSLEGRRFSSAMDLFLADSSGFACVSWRESPKSVRSA